jgi:hypothetical protein
MTVRTSVVGLRTYISRLGSKVAARRTILAIGPKFFLCYDVWD